MDAYEVTVMQVLSAQIKKLHAYEREAIWMQTPEGQSWDAEGEDRRATCPVDEDEIAEYLKVEYLYSVACDWSNRRIRKYLEQSP